MLLDDETYEVLGFGATRRFEQLAAYVERRRAQIREAQSRYAKSAKGKASIARRDAKRRENGYFAAWYAKNKERELAKMKAWYEKNRERKRAADKARYRAKHPKPEPKMTPAAIRMRAVRAARKNS